MSYKKGRAWIEVDIEALKHNVTLLTSLLPSECKLMPVIKAQAYGHGAVLIAHELQKMGISAYCVATISEGIELREANINGEILVLGYTHPSQFPLLETHKLTQTVVNREYAQKLQRYPGKIHVHIAIDTGMHRLGEASEDVSAFLEICKMDNLCVDGMFTHFSSADVLDAPHADFTRKQADAFSSLLCELDEHGIRRPKIHALSSYGVFNYSEFSFDYARVGIALYGVLSHEGDLPESARGLRPVLSLKARVATVTSLKRGEHAGYGLGFTASGDMKIATITIGYADGYSRSLSDGVGSILIQGIRVPVIGRVCMDQLLVDVSNLAEVKQDDVAVLIGVIGSGQISAYELAEKTGTITNEVLSRLGERLERLTV